jgi:hypothetical protein
LCATPRKDIRKVTRDEKFEHFCDSCVFDAKKKPKKKKKTNPHTTKKRKKNMQQKQGGKTNTTATTTTTTSSSKFNINNANNSMVRPRANNAHLFKKAR